MAHCNTIINQVAKLFSRHEFESLAEKHHCGQKLRKFTRWTQFLALMFAQLTSRKSLRDLEENLKAQKDKLYHLGMVGTSRATLARVNEKQPAALFEAVFYRLLGRCRQVAPGHNFKFKGKIYLLDATTILNLCLTLFPWALFRERKGALKLHLGLDADGHLPAFMALAEGKAHEVKWAQSLKLPVGSMAVFDRGFTDYKWYQRLTDRGVFFVTRLKDNALASFLRRRPGRKSAGVVGDWEIKPARMDSPLRLVVYVDAETQKEYRFVTNAFHLPAQTVADLYKERWQIELFFKWLKQNLKIKTFLGTSKNAVLTQLWIALCVYLLLAYLKFLSKIGLSLGQMLRILQLSLFERRELIALFKPPEPMVSKQLKLI